MTDKAEVNDLKPLHAFRFQVDFKEHMLKSGEGGEVVVSSGSFSECAGLEATVEPKVIKEGGRNWGPAQRMGPVTFSTVILKRGMTTNKHLWNWFDFLGNQERYAHRMNVTITMFDNAGDGVLAWKLSRAFPIKFKAADLNAKDGTQIAIEEIHLAHEGMTQENPQVASLYKKKNNKNEIEI